MEDKYRYFSRCNCSSHLEGAAGLSKDTSRIWCALEYSDFPRSLCFMWFWFELLTSKKTAPSLMRVEKFFCWNWAQRSGILRGFQKCVEFLRQEVTKFSKSLKIQFFCKKIFPLAKLETSTHFEISEKFCFFWYPVRPILKTFFSYSYKGRSYFFRRIKGQIR